MSGVYPYEEFSVGHLDETPSEAVARLGWEVVRRGIYGLVARGRAGEYVIWMTPTGPRALPANGAET